MKIAILDIAEIEYTPTTPLKRPLGGTQSAVCYLSQEMQSRGHTVTLYNHSKTTHNDASLITKPHPCLIADLVQTHFDVIWVIARWHNDIIERIRSATKAPIIGWLHESCFGYDAITPNPHFSAFVFVSDWQRKINAPFVPNGIPTYVIRNAIAPAFQNQTRSHRAPDQKDIRCVYVGDIPRGLQNVLWAWPRIQAARPAATLQIFCNITHDEHLEANRPFLELVLTVPGVIHAGPVSQSELAVHLNKADILLSPNPYPETSCIALMESLAAGLDAVVSDRAALPETAAGFARLVTTSDANNPTRIDAPVDMAMFYEEVLAAIDAASENIDENSAPAQRQKEQMDFFKTHYSYAARGKAWEDLFLSFARKG
jgi:glycosyltransferase involved in cell wall biosynthesis